MKNEKRMFAEYMNSDPWSAEFISECLDIYGCPRTYDDCLSREEEVWHMYSSMFLIGILEKMDEEVLESIKSISTNEAAYKYAKIYEEFYGEDLVMPFQGKGELHE